jgi:YkoY family integral membrane protein
MSPLLSAAVPPLLALWGQTFDVRDLAVVVLLIVLEGVLSIDNALVLGLLAKRLPKPLQARALSYGLIGAFVFRLLAIATATFLLKWTFAKFLGGAYLVYIAVKHLAFETREVEPDTIVLGAEGQPELVDAATHRPLSEERQELELQERVPFDLAEELPPRAATGAQVPSAQVWRDFWWTVFVIEMTDIAFAVDSILAAIGVVGSPPPATPPDALHPKLWVIILGGFLGVIVMRFAAAIFIRLLERFPRFETSAYLLVAVIGLKLLADWGLNSDWTEYGWIANRQWAEQYAEWLRSHWIWSQGAGGHGEHPHLLDFHDLRRPEALLFWFLMLAAFGLGFLPRRETAASEPVGPDRGGDVPGQHSRS